MSTKHESLLAETWKLRDDLRGVLGRTKRLDENGHIVDALERIDRDITDDLKYLISKTREERSPT